MVSARVGERMRAAPWQAGPAKSRAEWEPSVQVLQAGEGSQTGPGRCAHHASGKGSQRWGLPDTKRSEGGRDQENRGETRGPLREGSKAEVEGSLPESP